MRFIVIGIITSILSSWNLEAWAQIEKVSVETYYISDLNDATDTSGGHLPEGSITYRIFIDLMPGSKVLSIYGDETHPLLFSSTAPFFNHVEEGVTIGKDLNRNRYGLGTVALDSYITLGQCSRNFSQGAYFGVPKDADEDGSLIGGVNNDGGSQSIAGGLLANMAPHAGLALTVADGLVTSAVIPEAWIDIGFKDILTEEDTTIFGSGISKLSFFSADAILKNSGVRGVDALKNEILIAQLTTKGEISFELNFEVEIQNNGIPQLIRYVARNEFLTDNEVFSPLLKYPYTCGCTDPDYLEASTAFACADNNKCITPIVLGCTDSLACNYNPDANVNVQELCCYIGYCHDLDLRVACPDLKPRNEFEFNKPSLYPNPALVDLNIEWTSDPLNNIPYKIYNVFGQQLLAGYYEGSHKPISIYHFEPGAYFMQLELQDHLFTLPFSKI